MKQTDNDQYDNGCKSDGGPGMGSEWGLIAAAFLAGALGGAVAATLLHQRAYRREHQPVEIEPRQPQAPLVLIVDDDADFVELTSVILRQAGYRVAAAAEREGAFRLMRRDKPGLVLLDVMMKAPLEGLGILRQMATEHNLQDIPVVMISGIAQTEYAAEFPADIELPIEAWISKPVDPEQILATVGRIVPIRV